jgi:hypothetical protein
MIMDYYRSYKQRKQEKSMKAWMKRKIVALVAAAALAACGGGGGGDEDADTDIGGDPDVSDPRVDDAGDTGDPVEDPLPDVVTDDVVEEPACTSDADCDDGNLCNGEETCPAGTCVAGTPAADGTACETPEGDAGQCSAGTCVAPTGECGNGTVDAGEACDDSNAVTELCGSAADCLADCSMAQASCGNGSADTGEACDDGDTDSMNACTTSCTTNDHNIGAPCTCTGTGCSNTNFTAGTISGCESVSVPSGSGGVLGCFRSIHEGTSDYDTYYAEGYCTIMAVDCEGALCSMVPQPGDLDTFACPAGYYENEDVRTVYGMTITSKSCLQICTSDADCRWNAWDEFRDACGQYLCLPAPGDPSVSVCTDARML